MTQTLWCSLPTRPVTKDTPMADQLPLFQEGNRHQKSLPIYRVMLVREARMAYKEHQIRSAADASRMLATYLADVDREYFVVFLLDQKNHVIGIHTVSMGSLTASIVHPREVYKAAILANAAAIICGHNHPSGDVQPSSEDRALTLRLADAGKLLGIRVLDHIIIGSAGKYFSFADEGLLGTA
jgi:DNA repair protein RadC